MIDFGKKLTSKPPKKVLDPVALYETLDRASDKGPLRPAQTTVLKQWHTDHRDKPEVIVKLHTGQGKTLIGLLMLQSKLNQDAGPAVYLCPNNFLINQTCIQAQQFGISVCNAPRELPSDFLDSKSILVTSVQKFFNGWTKFGVGAHSMQIGSILMDDSHACVDAIRGAFTIRLSADGEAYRRLRDLFQSALKAQGAGTFVDIYEHSYDALLPVPYWEWRDKEDEVVKIIASEAHEDHVKFVWPLIKDSLADCLCVFSGNSVEISPYLPPISAFGSYTRATHRIFMSATVTNDAFLVKGLRLKPATIRSPLSYDAERWSGEKMIIVPDLVDASLSRSDIMQLLAPSHPGRHYGVVALTPSGAISKQWQEHGATVVTKDTIDECLKQLREKKCEDTLVIANRYDGIDLPDDMCRILILDSKPHADNLADRLADSCRINSAVMSLRAARTIEQGIGRSVRGEKDYSVVILTGGDLVDNVRSKRSRAYLSPQTRLQIEIGLEIIEFARDELRQGNAPLDVVKDLIRQCIGRNASWKEFYSERMNSLGSVNPDHTVLDQFQAELEAEEAFQAGEWQKAQSILQKFIDGAKLDATETGWYLQEMARYASPYDKIASNTLQKDAHRKSPLLLRPRDGMQVTKLEISGERIANIIQWVKQFETYEDLNVRICEITDRLVFGVTADRFEAAFDELGHALGFAAERPDKHWKEGPDNLWALEDGKYLLVECKDEVDLQRAEIYKGETGQMNNSLAWFTKNYPGAKSTNWMIIPASKLGPGAGVNQPVAAIRAKELGAFMKTVKGFFRAFQSLNFNSLSEEHVQTLINQHQLTVEKVIGYGRPVQ